MNQVNFYYGKQKTGKDYNSKNMGYWKDFILDSENNFRVLLLLALHQCSIDSKHDVNPNFFFFFFCTIHENEIQRVTSRFWIPKVEFNGWKTDGNIKRQIVGETSLKKIVKNMFNIISAVLHSIPRLD